MNLFDPKVAQSVVRSEAHIIVPDRFRIRDDVAVWAAVEVERQREPAARVQDMLRAWYYACVVSRKGPQYDVGTRKPGIKEILTLGYLVKPDLNNRGVSHYNVSVGWDQKLDWPQVPRALKNLVSEEAFDSLNSEQWYKEFEEIHPFGDGNGRVGSILLNWLRGTLLTPIYPPDVYDPYFFEKSFQGDDTFGDEE